MEGPTMQQQPITNLEAYDYVVDLRPAHAEIANIGKVRRPDASVPAVFSALVRLAWLVIFGKAGAQAP